MPVAPWWTFFREMSVKPKVLSWDKFHLVVTRGPSPMSVDCIPSYSDELLCVESYLMVMTTLRDQGPREESDTRKAACPGPHGVSCPGNVRLPNVCHFVLLLGADDQPLISFPGAPSLFEPHHYHVDGTFPEGVVSGMIWS